MAKPTYEELEAELDAAWKAYPSHGAVRGLVPLSEVIECLTRRVDRLNQRCSTQAETLAGIRAILAESEPRDDNADPT